MTPNEMEMAIANKIVDDALALNYLISVHDGGEWVVTRWHKKDEIMQNLNGTGIDNLKFHSKQGDYIGNVVLVWGNEGYTLIADYSDNEATEALLAGADALQDQYAEEDYTEMRMREAENHGAMDKYN